MCLQRLSSLSPRSTVSSMDWPLSASDVVESRSSGQNRSWSLATRQASRLVLTTNHCNTATGSVIVSDLRTSVSHTVCSTSSAVAESSREARAVCHKIGVRTRTSSPIFAWSPSRYSAKSRPARVARLSSTVPPFMQHRRNPMPSGKTVPLEHTPCRTWSPGASVQSYPQERDACALIRAADRLTAYVLADPLVDVAPAPRLAGLETAHDRVMGQGEMALGMPANGGVAASDVAAAQADPQVHGTRSLADAVLADARPVRRDGCGRVLEMTAWPSRHGRCSYRLIFEPIRPLGGDRKHGVLDVERPEYLLDDVVVDGAAGADF